MFGFLGFLSELPPGSPSSSTMHARRLGHCEKIASETACADTCGWDKPAIFFLLLFHREENREQKARSLFLRAADVVECSQIAKL